MTSLRNGHFSGDIMRVRDDSDVMGDRNGSDITGMLVMWEPVTHGTGVNVMSCWAVVMAWRMQGRAMTTLGSAVMTYHGMRQASVKGSEGRHLSV